MVNPKTMRRVARTIQRAAPYAIRYGPVIARGAIQAYRGVQSMRERFKRGQRDTYVKRPYFDTKRRRVLDVNAVVSRPPQFVRGYGPKKIKRGRRPKTDIYKKLGSEIALEYGGEAVPDANMTFTGHYDMPAMKLLETFIRACWRRLMRQRGVGFSDWDEPFVNQENATIRVGFIFRKASDTGKVYYYQNGPAFPTFWSHLTWCTNLTAVFYNNIDTTHESLIVLGMYIQRENIPLNTDVFETVVDLTNATFHVRSTSTMVLQNRTYGAGISDDQVTDVTNNPVKCRSWTVRGNQMLPASSRETQTLSTADVDSGIIVSGVDTSQNTGKLNAPTAYRHVVASSRFNIQPGQIRKSVLSDKYTMSVNTLMEKMAGFLRLSVNTGTPSLARVAIGKSRLFQFEKVCDTNLGSQNISIGFEINVLLASYITTRVGETNRLAQVF